MISKTKLIYAFPCILFFVCCPGCLVILIQVDIQNQIDRCFSFYFVFRFLSWLISHFNSSWYPKPNWFILSLVFCFSFVLLVDSSFEFKLISKTKLIYAFLCILFLVFWSGWLVIVIQVDIQNQIDLFFRLYFFFLCCSGWSVFLNQVNIQNQIDLCFPLYFAFRLLSWLITHFNSSWFPKPNWFMLSLVFCFSFVLLVD